MDAQEANIYNAILITALVLGVIIIFFVVSIIRQQRKTLNLHRDKIMAEISILEKERSRIAHDLHDEIGPLLSAVKMKINSFEMPDAADQQEVDATNDHINDVLKRIREISYDLLPSSLIRKGLVPAVREFVGYLNNPGKINFTLQDSGEIDVSNDRAINIYRIIQEVIHNCLKHSRANEVSIKLAKEKKKLILDIADNGTGFVKDQIKGNGLGLRSLVSRVEVLGGSLYLDTAPGKGTHYTIEIPIEHA